MALWYSRNNAKIGGGWSAANNATAPITGPVATVSVIDGSDVASATGAVGKFVATATFQTKAAVAYPDGIRVTAYDAAGYSAGNAAAINSALIAGGAGAVSIDVFEAPDVILVCDPLAAGIGLEVNMTKSVTPVFV